MSKKTTALEDAKKGAADARKRLKKAYAEMWKKVGSAEEEACRKEEDLRRKRDRRDKR